MRSFSSFSSYIHSLLEANLSSSVTFDKLDDIYVIIFPIILLSIIFLMGIVLTLSVVFEIYTYIHL